MCYVWERVCFFSRIKETRKSEACPGKSYTKRTRKVLIAIDEFMNIVKTCADSCNEDLCLPENTRKMFSSFDFASDDAVELWVVLKPVVEKFHGNAENYYSNLQIIKTAIQVHKLYFKFKLSKNEDCVYSKPCLSILLCCKRDSDDSRTLIDAKDRGRLWRINETVQNIFIACEKIFRSFTSAFRLVFKYSELVQEMQANSIIISNHDSLCYSIEPRVNKKLSLNC